MYNLSMERGKVPAPKSLARANFIDLKSEVRFMSTESEKDTIEVLTKIAIIKGEVALCAAMAVTRDVTCVKRINRIVTGLCTLQGVFVNLNIGLCREKTQCAEEMVNDAKCHLVKHKRYTTAWNKLRLAQGYLKECETHFIGIDAHDKDLKAICEKEGGFYFFVN